MLDKEIIIILLVLVVLIILAVHLNDYYIKQKYKKNSKGLRYLIKNINEDKVNLGFYNALTKKIEWIYEVSYNYSKKKGNKYLPILIKKCYNKDGLALFNDIDAYSSIAQVQLHNLLELEAYNILLDEYKSS